MKREKILRISIASVYLLAGIVYLLVATGATGRAQATVPQQGGAEQAGCRFPLPLPSVVGVKDFETRVLPFLKQRCYRTLKWVGDREIRNTGPFINGTAFGTHPAVRIYYSPEMWTWMKVRQRQGEVPDGAMIVKEQYSTPASAQSTLSGWTVMVRDKNGSWDGWFWDGHGLNDTPDTPPFDFKGQGFGTYCVRCHASALNATQTFSDVRNVEDDPVSYLTQLPTLPTPKPTPVPSLHEQARSAHVTNQLDLAAPVPPNVKSFPNEGFDHVVSSHKGPGQFLTSDQCIGCHSASDTNMAYLFGPLPVNLSPYTEWRASMMGLAGRDPVFHAQLEAERAQFPDKSDFLDNKCFHCHGVMGQRQLQLDKKQSFTHDMIYALADQPGGASQYATYGALARDGVSCMVCHQIAAKGLGPDGQPVVTGEPSSYTGNFPVDAPGTVNGPFSDVQPLPMKNALGITPRFADQIKRSTVCGTCHTVIVPVFDRNGKEVLDKSGKPKEFHEQTTYLEWQNSDFQDERAPINKETARTCQQCHMPSMYKQTPLTFRIANIEDNTYPFVDNRLPDADITLKTRDYSRHTLVALNVFVNQMFQQFNEILGVAPNDYMYPVAGNGAKPVEGLVTTEQSMLDMACNETAEVEVVSARKTGDRMEVSVRVTNLAGHSFPSGVEFRRAFVNLRMLDANGQAVWASGETNKKGEILDGLTGKILPTEYFDLVCKNQPDPQKCRALCKDKIVPGVCREQIQPHYFSGNPITRGDQVQIYEELVTDSDGFITNSFVRLDEHIKDNRLLPKGWRPDGPSAGFTRPFAGAERDPGYINPVKGKGSEGSNTVVYLIPLGDLRGDVASVTASLFYQTIPPYYLRDRFALLDRNLPDAMTRETVRLKYLSDQLKVENTAIKDWKLLITCRSRRLSDGVQLSCAPCQQGRDLLVTRR